MRKHRDTGSKISAIKFLINVFFIIFILLTAYYLATQTILYSRALPNIKINGVNVSFLTENEVYNLLKIKLYESNVQTLTVKYGNNITYIPLDKLTPTLKANEIVKYGKESNPIQNLKTATTLLEGKEFVLELEMNIDPIVESIPVKTTTDWTKTPQILNNELIGCENNMIIGNLDTIALKTETSDALLQNHPLVIDFEKLYGLTKEQTNLMNLCLQYKSEKGLIEDYISTISGTNEVDVFEYVAFKITGNAGKWEIRDENKIKQTLTSYSNTSEIVLFNGIYEIHNNQIYLFQNYQVGKKVNPTTTYDSFTMWLSNPNTPMLMDIQETYPSYLGTKEILDFTKQIGVGMTRVNTITDNPDGNIAYAEVGFSEINNVIVNPDQEFSFYNILKPDANYYTASGKPIGGGICTTSTTIFRAALESGFIITDRANHGYNWSKYIWPYPYGIVDSTYLTNPKIDIKFVNDLDYPVILKYEKTFGEGNFQYNKIYVFSSSKTPDRKVELKNWQIWNYSGFTNFEGSFDRVVTDNGIVTRTDNFYSKYTGGGRLN